ncbi:MAG TPA: Scr1 family TA system antitoxin-like transcriptional regulator [Actinomadura sp.]|nr:Scr1 family TA system antitoxin-like transcriptional regulator [Actinomadura sp.]
MPTSLGTSETGWYRGSFPWPPIRHRIQELRSGDGWPTACDFTALNGDFPARPRAPGLIQLPEYAGGPKAMRRRLARLLEASESPNIGIRVVPRSAGAHPGADGRPRDHHET